MTFCGEVEINICSSVYVKGSIADLLMSRLVLVLIKRHTIIPSVRVDHKACGLLLTLVMFSHGSQK